MRLTVAADLDDEARFAERAVVLSETELRIEAAAGSEADGAVAIPVRTIESAEVVPVTGGAVLRIRTREGTRDVARFTSSRVDSFARLVRAVRRASKGRPFDGGEAGSPERCPTCGRLLPDRRERCPFCVRYFETLRRVLVYLKPYRRKAAWLTSLMLVATGAELVPPLITRTLIDSAIPHKDFALLGWLVAGFLAVRITYVSLSVYNGGLLAWLGGRVGADIRLQIFSAVERLPFRFFDRRHAGQIFSRVMNDSGQLESFLSEHVPYLLHNVLLVVGVVLILFSQSPELTFLILLPVPFMLLGHWSFWRRVRLLNHKAWNQLSQLNARLLESLSGARVVKSFSQEPREVARFGRQSTMLFRAQYAVERFWARYHPSAHFFVSSGILIVWYFGGRSVIAAEMTLGTLVAFLAYLWMFYGPLQWFTQVNNAMARAFAGAERIFETLETAPEVYEPADAVALAAPRGEVEFRNVSFSYEKGRTALSDLSFTVRAGERVGLVGVSGSGKSTLLSLLARFYDPDEGEILLDGVPLSRIRLEDVRRATGLVLQDPFLFSASIFENVAYGRPEASWRDVVSAARAANAHEFTMQKPDAYDTRVGERGSRLSGGEKQRIAIARALLSDPRILILDEATSSVDSVTETRIQQALERLMAGRTVFLAAHRLATLRSVDRIFVLERGKLVESGTHEELMRRRGRFHKLVRAQEKMWKRARREIPVGVAQEAAA